MLLRIEYGHIRNERKTNCAILTSILQTNSRHTNWSLPKKSVSRSQVKYWADPWWYRLKEKLLKLWKGAHSRHFRYCLPVSELLSALFGLGTFFIFTLFICIFRFFPYITVAVAPRHTCGRKVANFLTVDNIMGSPLKD